MAGKERLDPVMDAGLDQNQVSKGINQRYSSRVKSAVDLTRCGRKEGFPPNEKTVHPFDTL
ncbi:MAG: hypothetical protein WBP89_03360 [Sedimenticolaceae bacterium]